MRNIFKKIFGGKSQGKSEDGTNIYTYGQQTERDNKIYTTKYIEEIQEHFEKLFPGGETNVFHELISDIVHIDIGIIGPTEERPFSILYTIGMSSMPMTLPDDFPEEDRESCSRAELMMFLPGDWELSQEGFKDENNYWPIRLLKSMARFPHEYNTWLGYGHTVPNFETYDNYADNTGLNSVIFTMFKEEISILKTKDGNTINIYYALPLYKEETEYKLENGMEALMEKLQDVDWIILDPQRRNTCK